MIGITLGDPAGIGPEITALALAHCKEMAFTIFGHRHRVEAAARLHGIDLPRCEWEEPPIDPVINMGEPSAASGSVAIAQLVAATAAAKAGRISAIATAPLSKAWVRAAGFGFPGHTEFLADAWQCDVAMMFAGPRLKVALATVHEPLAHVATRLTSAGIERTTRLLWRAMNEAFGIAHPRIGVVGLNPHAGEGGLLGDEERRLIGPAVEAMASLGVVGPLVPDVAFRQAIEGRFDALVAMYHDQALIPVKLIDFESAVNVTIGLPVVRTSPDHGTAFDIAGRGVARATSMIAALELAYSITQRALRQGT